MSTGAKLVYKPIGALMGILGGLIAGFIFKRVWRLATQQDEAPTATGHDSSWRAVVLAAAVEGAIFAAVKALIDRAGAKGFERLTGAWPGE
jgi:hypothetical protein